MRCFLSLELAGRGEELFGGLEVWADPAMRALQGTVPVVALSFARVKGATLDETLAGLRRVIRVAVEAHGYLRGSAALTDGDRAFLARVSDDMPDKVAADAPLCLAFGTVLTVVALAGIRRATARAV